MIASGRLVRLGVVLTTVYAASLLPAAAQGTPEQQQLCSGDAFRLCSDAIPDVDRVTACMIARRAELSPGCKSVFRYEPATPAVQRVSPVRAGKPVTIKPRKAKKARRRE